MSNFLDEKYRNRLMGLGVGTTPEVRLPLTFGGAAKASLEKTYSDISDRLRFGENFNELNSDFDPELDVYEALPDRLKPFAGDFASARNSEHLQRMILSFDQSMTRLDDLSRTSGLKNFVAATVVDPLNLVPFGGVSTSFLRSVRNAGALGFAMSVTQEAASSQSLTRQPEERLLNIGMNTVFASVLGGASSIPAKFRAAAFENAVQNMNAVNQIFPSAPKTSTAIPPQATTAQLNVSELPVSNFYVGSRADRFITTPYKRTMQPDVPISVQNNMYDLGASHDLISLANQAGQTRGASVYIEASRGSAEWYKFYEAVRQGWSRRRGGSTRVGLADLSDLSIRTKKSMDRILGRPLQREQTIDEFSEEIGRKYILGISGADEFEQRAIDELKSFFSANEVRLREAGLIGAPKYWTAEINKLNQFLDGTLRPRRQELADRLRTATKKKDQNILKKRISALDDKIQQFEKKVKSFEAELDASKKIPVAPQGQDNHFPRFWRQDELRANPALRKELEDVIFQHFMSKNRIITRDKDGLFVVTLRDKDPKLVRKRAEEAVKEILNEDFYDLNNLTYGAGTSMNLRHRKLDIPNELVLKFIETNPIVVAKAYSQRVAPAYSFHKKFGGRSLDELELENTLEMQKAGLSDDRISEVNADFRTMYERIAGKVLRSPDRWDFKTYQSLQAMMRMNYLGGTALLSVVTEPMRLVMEYGLPKTMRAVSAYATNAKVRASAREGRLVGQGLEGALGSAILRISEDLSNNPFAKNMFDNVQDGFFAVSGLNFVTRTLKDLDVILRQHKFIEDALQDAAGTLDDKSVAILRKHGLSKSDSKGIAKFVQDGLIQKDPDTGFFFANTESWPQGKVLENFRNSLSIGVMNTIIMASPADKPRMVDGVALVPHRIGKQFGFQEDPNYKGYSRIESPLLAAPFGLMSFTLGANNKVLGAATQGQYKHLLSGVLFGMGASWMLLSYRTPDYIWDEMSLSDKIARSFDLTGLGGIWLDLVYRGITMGEATGFGNPAGGIISPRFPPDQGIGSVATEILGPSSSWAYDTASAVIDLASGNLSEGSSDLIRQMPGVTLFYWKHLVNEWRRGLEDALPEEIGFRRF